MEILNYKEFRVTNEMLASKSKRFANFIIDRIIFYSLFIVFGIILAFVGALLGSEAVLNYLDGLENINPFLDFLITGMAFTLFYFILESLSQQTIGKLITKTKVVLENGDKPKPETIVIRSLCRMIPFEPFSFLGELPRGWHDSISKTYVVDTKIFDEQKMAHSNFNNIGKQT